MPERSCQDRDDSKLIAKRMTEIVKEYGRLHGLFRFTETTDLTVHIVSGSELYGLRNPSGEITRVRMIEGVKKME